MECGGGGPSAFCCTVEFEFGLKCFFGVMNFWGNQLLRRNYEF